MPNLMLQFHHTGEKPTLEQARALFELDADDVDEEYGVVATDRSAGLYVILVKPEVVPKAEDALARRTRHPAEGIFGNPPVESMDRRGEH